VGRGQGRGRATYLTGRAGKGGGKRRSSIIRKTIRTQRQIEAQSRCCFSPIAARRRKKETRARPRSPFDCEKGIPSALRTAGGRGKREKRVCLELDCIRGHRKSDEHEKGGLFTSLICRGIRGTITKKRPRLGVPALSGNKEKRTAWQVVFGPRYPRTARKKKARTAAPWGGWGQTGDKRKKKNN